MRAGSVRPLPRSPRVAPLASRGPDLLGGNSARPPGTQRARSVSIPTARAPARRTHRQSRSPAPGRSARTLPSRDRVLRTPSRSPRRGVGSGHSYRDWRARGRVARVPRALPSQSLRPQEQRRLPIDPAVDGPRRSAGEGRGPEQRLRASMRGPRPPVGTSPRRRVPRATRGDAPIGFRVGASPGSGRAVPRRGRARPARDGARNPPRGRAGGSACRRTAHSVEDESLEDVCHGLIGRHHRLGEREGEPSAEDDQGRHCLLLRLAELGPGLLERRVERGVTRVGIPGTRQEGPAARRRRSSAAGNVRALAAANSMARGMPSSWVTIASASPRSSATPAVLTRSRKRVAAGLGPPSIGGFDRERADGQTLSPRSRAECETSPGASLPTDPQWSQSSIGQLPRRPAPRCRG